MADGDEEEEVFIDCGASPELRRSTRTSGRKRSSTGGLPSFKPKKRMSLKSTAEVPEGSRSGQAPPPKDNPFSELSHSQPSSTTDPIMASMQAMLTGMEGRLIIATANLQASVTVKIDGAMAAIGDLRSRVDKQDERMDGILGEVTSMVGQQVQQELKRFKDGDHGALAPPRAGSYEADFPVSVALDPDLNVLPRRYSSSYATALASNRPPAEPAPLSKESQIKKDYWRARNALRLRPIPPGDDHAGVMNFLTEYLRLEAEVVTSLGQLKIERIPFGPKSKQKNEVLVRFGSTEARDVVKGSASNLAGNGPEVGIRLELPNHLKSNMKSLQQLSYDIKQTHPRSRQNVLYDDDSMDLVLDICLDEGLQWRRITAGQARERIRKKKRSANG